jgi:hypothetical protein
MTEKRRLELCNFVRWFDLIQNQPLLTESRLLPYVNIQLDVPLETATTTASQDVCYDVHLFRLLVACFFMVVLY